MDILRQKRLVQSFIIFGVISLLLVGRLWFIQIREGKSYTVLALEQYSQVVSLEDAPRGVILDRNLVPITGERIESKVVLFPTAIKDKAPVARELAEILSLDVSMVEPFLYRGPCYLPFALSDEQKTTVRDKEWSGVKVMPVQFRYGEKTLAAQVVGHVGKISTMDEFIALNEQGEKSYRYGDLVGKTGLEKYYEDDLKGTAPQRLIRVFTDAGGRLLGGPGFMLEEGVGDSERRDLVLTVDQRIQQAVEEIMDERVVKGAVVVMEAGSGDILALASRPGFNPAHPEQSLSTGIEDRFFDHCTALYQPGSVFKVVLAAAALEEGLVQLDSRYECGGSGDTLIHCWKDEGHGDINFAEAFAQSCNPSFARIGLELGAQKLIEYAYRMGLGDQTVIGYPFQMDSRQDLGLMAAPYNLVNSSVGQGPVLATPIQITAMLNTVVSDGVYRQPRLVKEVRNSDGSTRREFLSDKGTQSFSPATAIKLRHLLELVIDEGVGKEASLTAFGSAGKTGSAQIGNDKGIINAWFTGYAPRVNPRYVVTVLVEEGISGGVSAAPVFREIMDYILR